MRKLVVLLKMMTNTWYGISVFRDKASKNKAEILKLLGLVILIIISVAPMLGGYIYYLWNNYNVLAQFNQQGAIITLGVVASCVMVLLFGFLFVISTFYFSDDTEHLITMPLKPYQILGAKFGVIMSTEYMTVIPFVLPPIIVYGLKSGAGLLYWLYSLAGVLILPIIPLCLTSIIAVVIMRITNIGRKKDLYRIIGGIFGIVLLIGADFFIQRAMISGDPEQIRSILFSENGLVNIVAANFPPAKLISEALIRYYTIKGFLSFLLFVGLSLVFIVVFGYIGEKLFLGGYLGSRETVAKAKRLGEGQLASKVSVKSKVWAIFWREFKIINRVPIFFINCVFAVFLVPAMLVAMPIIGGEDLSSELGFLINNSSSTYLLSLVAAGIAIFTSAANMTAPTSISREGAEFYVSKYIPVSPREQIMGKFIHALLLDVTGSLLTVAAIGFILKTDIVVLIISFIISSLAAIPIIEMSLIIDLFRPYLNWDNPTKAVKQNINGVVAMLFCALWNALILLGIGKFVKSPAIGYTLLIIIYLVLGAIMYKFLMAYAQKRYGEIEA